MDEMQEMQQRASSEANGAALSTGSLDRSRQQSFEPRASSLDRIG